MWREGEPKKDFFEIGFGLTSDFFSSSNSRSSGRGGQTVADIVFIHNQTSGITRRTGKILLSLIWEGHSRFGRLQLVNLLELSLNPDSSALNHEHLERNCLSLFLTRVLSIIKCDEYLFKNIPASAASILSRNGS